MSIDQIEVPGADRPAAAPGGSSRRGLLFWIRRYLPAEILGTAVMLAAGWMAGLWTDIGPLIAAAALVGEIVGFYLVLAIAIYVEQSREGDTMRGVLVRTMALLVAEFGLAEVLDTVLIRPAALTIGLALIGEPVWGLLAGKIVADIVFYAVAAGAFTLTVRAGLRRRRTVTVVEA